MVLFVGRLVECKGVDYLIRAMAEIQKEKPDAELVVIGDGHHAQGIANNKPKTHCADFGFWGRSHQKLFANG